MNSSSLTYDSTSSHSLESVGGNDAHYLISEQYNKFLRLINESSMNEDIIAIANMASIPLFQCFNLCVSYQS